MVCIAKFLGLVLALISASLVATATETAPTTVPTTVPTTTPTTTPAQSASKALTSVSAPPSEELLMFLAEFAEVDDEDFNLLMERGKRDAEQSTEPAAETEQRGINHE